MSGFPAGAHEGGLTVSRQPRFSHPEGFDDNLTIGAVSIMVQRALNCVDPRLVDHGLRVASLLDAMLEVNGMIDATQRRAAYFIALLHDVGAYRTEEIDRMVAFETESVWEHSFYGYLFFKELSPLGDYAEVVLFHHMPYDQFTDQNPYVKFLATALHVADRVDILLLEHPQADAAEVERLLATSRPGLFSPEALALFAEAQRRFDVVARLRAGVEVPDPSHIVADPNGTGSATSYLDMLVHVIDFRSRHTVTHTVTTAWVAYELALRLLGDQPSAAHVYASALVHDVGKIGIPLSILEKPGRLDDEEMAVMRTHVALTERILEDCVEPEMVLPAVRHHEKLDGSGYPRGLHAGELTPPDRIIAVADIVSALVRTRSYKQAYPKDKVLALLADQVAAGKIDAAVVEAMTRDYDAIMASVAAACLPVAAAYERVQDQYLWLLSELKNVQAENEERNA